ncbi:sugar ABC transporter substrate-binding protein [Devosia sp. 919]|uniref:sugar ABC transporter substrate-binding protein n=1 Tax=Devosia sp. 919 TaxID=2726065 RepID=UPI0015542D86|nr:sugar ABC transporter substrate-binding protein [Devosia sp. 919]
MSMIGKPMRRRTLVCRASLAALILASGLSSVSAQDKQVELGFVYWETKTDAFVQMANGGKAVGDLDPRVNVLTAAPDTGDPQRQVALFGPIAQTQTDGVVLQSLVSGPMTRPAADATGSGTPMVAIDAPPPDGAGIGLFITADNTGIGAQIAEKVLALVPADAKGTVIIGNTGVGVPPLDMRAQGMVDKIKELRPDLKIVGPVATNGVSSSSAEVFAAWQGLLASNPDAVAVMAPSAQDPSAWGLLAQRTGFDLPSGGFDLEAGNLQAVKDGYVDYIMSPSHWLSGYLATRALANAALGEGELLQGLLLVPGELVSADNIDAVIARQENATTVAAALAPIGDDILANAGNYIVGPWPPQ